MDVAQFLVKRGLDATPGLVGEVKVKAREWDESLKLICVMSFGLT